MLACEENKKEIQNLLSFSKQRPSQTIYASRARLLRVLTAMATTTLAGHSCMMITTAQSYIGTGNARHRFACIAYATGEKALTLAIFFLAAARKRISHRLRELLYVVSAHTCTAKH